MSATTAGLDCWSGGVRTAHCLRWRKPDLPGSWVTLAYPPRSSTPPDRTPQALSGRTMLPSAQKTTSAPETDSFRGSITQLACPLCTLRSWGRPHSTQHSVPAGGQPLPGQDSHLLGHDRKFQPCNILYMSFPSSKLCLAQFPRKRIWTWSRGLLMAVSRSLLSRRNKLTRQVRFSTTVNTRAQRGAETVFRQRCSPRRARTWSYSPLAVTSPGATGSPLTTLIRYHNVRGSPFMALPPLREK